MNNSQLAKELRSLLGDDRVLYNESMASHTTFRIGGPADFFVTPSSINDITAAVALCRDHAVDVYVLGHGSNVLVADAGIRGVVVYLSPEFGAVSIQDNTVTAQAGASCAKVASAARDAGLSGFEFAAGIPGTIGGAALMNAGAYGGELCDVAVSVDCLSQEGQIVTLTAEEARWGYRTSAIADNGFIVLQVVLCLQQGDPLQIQTVMDDLAVRRREKQPLEMPSAGSTFKRPQGDFAGRLIQEAGMRGYAVGAAQVSEKHAGFVVNNGGATAADVYAVITDVQRAVYDKSGVMLQPEIRFWGEFL